MNSGTTQLEFEYNADGLRTVKKLNTDTITELSTVYHYDGTNLTHMIWDETDYIHFYYDGNGQRVVMDYNGVEYFYVYNAQGDVVALADKDGNVVVEYTYDAWGKPLSVTGSLASTVGQINSEGYLQKRPSRQGLAAGYCLCIDGEQDKARILFAYNHRFRVFSSI